MDSKFLFLISLFVSPLTLAADVTVYRWVDENGVLHYSQHHPLENDYSEIKIETKYSPLQAPLKNGTKTNADEDELALELAQTSNIKCKNAQTNLRTLTDFDKIEMTDTNGKSRILSEMEKLKRLRLSEKEVEIYCQE